MKKNNSVSSFFLVYYLFVLFGCYSISSIADTKVCNIVNGEYFGDCSAVKNDRRIENSIITSYQSVGSIINNAQIGSGGVLNLTGICNGDVIIHQGGKLILSGIVNGTVENRGGIADINGQATKVVAISGVTTISGVVTHVSLVGGKVTYQPSAVVNGKSAN